MADPNLVNIGTERRAVLVPASAISKDLEEEQKYWRGVATGSTFPSGNRKTDQEAVDRLLKRK